MTKPISTDAEGFATLLLVEPDPLLRELLASSLELHQPEWRVETVDTAEAARERLSADQPVDLVILELRLPEPRRGVELVRELRSRPARLPVLVVTANPEEAWRRSLDVDALLVKPLDVDQVLARVERLLALQRGSVVRGIALPALLQMLELERKDCTLRVSSGRRSGRVWVRAGALVRAETKGRRGRAALFEMLDWNEPVVEVVSRCDTPSTMEVSLQALLLEHAVDRDQGSRG